ncbi:aldehyde oxidase 2 [Bombina bombina]|uniref:aldehyde oxidase 2 n=1 Tax=Bombina bombina TaxID=8345 RepID=UPI00235A722F|nr:aldehyde oxidase 2 [Bombina bombina]
MEDQKWKTLVLQGDRSTWLTPSCLPELLQLKSLYPMAPLVVGNTFIGPQIKLVGSFYPVIISPARVPELSIVSYSEKGITIGAACSLALVKSILSEAVSQLPEEKSKIFRVIMHQLAGQQIRSDASLGGSILSGSSSWELNPILAVGNCTFNLASKDRKRQVTLRQLLFDEPGKGSLRPEEILISVNIPFSQKWEFVSAFRQVQRWGNAAPASVAAIKVIFREGTDLILGMDMYYGGSEPAREFAQIVSEHLIGSHWNEAMLDEACRFFLDEVPVQDSALFGVVVNERTLTISFLYKFYLQVLKELKQLGNFLHPTNPDSPLSPYSLYNGNNPMNHYQQRTSNGFHVNYDDNPQDRYEHTNGNHMTHKSHVLQTIVEEEYDDEDDIPVEGQLFLALVTSQRPHAKIMSIHTDEALKVPGVFDVLTASDVSGTNGSYFFAENEVHYVGQVICAVLADTHNHAKLGAARVRIDYYDLEPVIFSVQDAIKHKSLFEPVRKLEQGNVEDAFTSADHILEGEEYIGDQEDVEYGTQTVRVIPREDDNELDVYVPTQDPLSVKASVASAINIPSDFIICHTEPGNLGTRCPYQDSVAAITAVAALKTGQIVQCVTEHRKGASGYSHQPKYLEKYKVGYMNDGRIVALDVTYYCNVGYLPDESHKVLAVSLLGLQNAYSIPNIRCSVTTCRTNLPPGALCRGYGYPQVGMLSEIWIDTVANRCSLPAEKVRQMNLHKAKSQTCIKSEFNAANLLKCWNECMERSSYHKRRAAATESNKQCPWKKKGLSIVPVMFPVGFIADFLNQSSALVHIYKDGWVLVTPGGSEIGQETYTKIMQVVSRELRIPISFIHISDSSTAVTSDSCTTDASIGSTAHEIAVQEACQILLQRLQPIISMNSEATWKDYVQEAFRLRICLSATGHYRNAETNLDWGLKEGTESPDFIFGAACSEVELNCRTGMHKNLRTDIVLDVGSNISQDVDVDQIKQAFIQGIGLFTGEDFKYFDEGAVNGLQTGSSTPCNAPEQLNVSLLTSTLNPYMTCSCRGVEEVSLFLASSLFFALKDAVLAARNHIGLTGTILLPVPARPQYVRLACGSYLTSTEQITHTEECTENHISET